jgi:hypothetical protein
LSALPGEAPQTKKISLIKNKKIIKNNFAWYQEFEFDFFKQTKVAKKMYFFWHFWKKKFVWN